jgi:hypothetical protein
MALGKMLIARRHAALERQVQAVRNIVATLSEIAKSKKDNPRHGVHVKLRLAQGKLAERERRLDKFNAQHPVPKD